MMGSTEKHQTLGEILESKWGGFDLINRIDIKAAVKDWLQQLHDEINNRRCCTDREEQRDCDNLILISQLIKELSL